MDRSVKICFMARESSFILKKIIMLGLGRVIKLTDTVNFIISKVSFIEDNG